MDKHVAFAIFGSVICLASALGTYFIIRSNRRLEQERKQQTSAKDLARNH